ncbi:hypothetical protein LIA77_12011 [Sarocladium implicatum]|nr:hypothetical protein LIA77_12011 [Sarocladium implicatum]
MNIRRARADDLSAITDIILASLADDPSWKTLFTSDIRKDLEYDLYIRETVKEYLDPETPEWLVLVAEAPRRNTAIIASVAIWNVSLARFSSSSRRDSSSTICNFGEAIEVMSSDIDITIIDKLTSLKTTVSFSQKEHFKNLEPCVYLEVLATHPVYRGKGYAKALCTEVISSAEEHRLPVAVMSSLRGYIFFSGLKFKDLGCVVLRGPDKKLEDCVLKAMVHCPPPKKNRPVMVNWILRHVNA